MSFKELKLKNQQQPCQPKEILIEKIQKVLESKKN
jgi:hypothetical protein